MLADIPISCFKQCVKTKQIFIPASSWPQHLPPAVPSSGVGNQSGGGNSGFNSWLLRVYTAHVPSFSHFLSPQLLPAQSPSGQNWSCAACAVVHLVLRCTHRFLPPFLTSVLPFLKALPTVMGHDLPLPAQALQPWPTDWMVSQNLK